MPRPTDLFKETRVIARPQSNAWTADDARIYAELEQAFRRQAARRGGSGDGAMVPGGLHYRAVRGSSGVHNSRPPASFPLGNRVRASDYLVLALVYAAIAVLEVFVGALYGAVFAVRLCRWGWELLRGGRK